MAVHEWNVGERVNSEGGAGLPAGGGAGGGVLGSLMAAYISMSWLVGVAERLA